MKEYKDHLIFSIDEAVHFGWDKMKKHFWFFVALIIVMGLVSALTDGYDDFANIQSSMNNGTVDWNSIFNSEQPTNPIITLISMVVSILTSIVWIKSTLLLLDNKEVTVSNIAQAFNKFFYVLGATIAYVVIVTVGFILFIIPGIIWAIRFQYANQLIIDKDLGIGDALKKSFAMTKGSTLELAGFSFIGGILNILGFLALGIGLFASIPTIAMAQIYVYRKLAEKDA